MHVANVAFATAIAVAHAGGHNLRDGGTLRYRLWVALLLGTNDKQLSMVATHKVGLVG